MRTRNDLKTYLRKQKKIFYWLKCWIKRNDTQFTNFVSGNYVYLPMKNNGNLNIGKTFYYIYFNNESEILGLATLWTRTIWYLLFAYQTGLIPIVEWGVDIPYAQPELLKDNDNSFEHYFNLVTEFSIEEVKNSHNVIDCDMSHLRNHIWIENKSYSIIDTNFEIMAYISRKYIDLNDELKDFIKKDNTYQMILNGRYIGVHIRGTDFRRNYNNHPVSLDINDYTNYIDDLIIRGNIDGIFLATDDENIINEMNSKYTERLVFFIDVYRSVTGKAIHYDIESKRSLHKYKMGRELIRDIYTLAACDIFISGLSAVSTMTKVINKQQADQFSEVILIDKGINNNLRNMKKA
ncbi:MAG: hypothetical protein FWC41_04490 [Firmicutes bacterium]|nr:hypothetical protein [Bacillota bacterium]